MSRWSLQALKVKQNDPLSAAKWNQLIHEIELMTPTGGPLTRITQTSNGVIISPTSTSTPSYPWPFQPNEGSTGISFNYGTVGGVEPMIDGTAISDDSSGAVPELAVQPNDLVYFMCTLSSFEVIEVDIVALQTRPTLAKNLAYKLLGVNKPSGFVPAVFFNLGFWASNQRPSGLARYWFFAQ